MRAAMDRGWTRTRAWAAPVALGLAALSTPAAWRAIAADRRPDRPLDRPLDRSARTGRAIPAVAAPAHGVTGTTDLPLVPVSVAAALAAMRADAGAAVAAPFSMAAARGPDRGRALACLTAAIYYEAASEPDAGQSAVAQVILNRVRHPAFPATVCGVVYQGSGHAGCQFSFACDGAMAKLPVRGPWIRAARAAAMALAGYVYAPVGLATHYHTYAVTPAWNRGLVLTDVVGAHLFHRWKGYWGTRAAFGQPYRGGEPLPGPLAAPDASPAILGTAVPAPTVAPITAAAAAAIEPGDAVPATPATDRLPPAATVLDRWKDTGTPLS
ncbi:cell wall hydrolase [Sphingomonas sp. A2-49]|uniref:cell wall hydrolase n=1 Tax=Sphingomonas sp. A2-49 TaxID=1391375 RepID=UPI0021CF37EE|nr:cell wall hydrolase [Sphingomonas sp. A2-49]MCU6455373.1 cell wall hydrolase [Sphingomonas sp. A2-49]